MYLLMKCCWFVGCHWVPLCAWASTHIQHSVLRHGFIWVDYFKIYMVHLFYVFHHAILHLLRNDDNSSHAESQCSFHHCCSFLYALEPLQWIYDTSQGTSTCSPLIAKVDGKIKFRSKAFLVVMRQHHYITNKMNFTYN